MNAKAMVWLRRAVQVALLAVFGWLFVTGRFFIIDPLALLSALLAAHTAPKLLLYSLITLGVTLILGRVFCGWVCPFGTIHNMAGWLRGKRRRMAAVLGAWSPWQRLKYFLFVALVVMALLGANGLGIFDPFSVLCRSVATALIPAAQYSVEETATAVYKGDPHWGRVHLKSITEPVYRLLRANVFQTPRPVYQSSALVLCVFIAIVALNLVRPRFWCRYVCPLGALLGTVSKRAILRLKNDRETCTGCMRCTMRCPAAAQPEKPGEWLATECFGCWNCVAACKVGSVAFTFGAPWQRPSEGRLDVSRRALFASALSGVGAALMFRIRPQAQGRTYNPALIRPPGSQAEPEFLRRCIQCGLCMKVCPTNALHPTFAEAGIEGLWTPRLVPRIGYCDYECNRCGQVCPTGAIQPLSLEQKKQVKIGLASFDTTRCLPYAYGRSCVVCEEHCPTPTKAIFGVEREVALRDGRTRVVRQPYVDVSLCIGCGTCENVCPFKDQPAVRVTSANETRHRANQPVLPGAEGYDPYGPANGAGG